MIITPQLTIDNHNKPQEELKKLLNLIDNMENEYKLAEPEFKPFVVGPVLNAIYKSIRDANSEISNSPHEAIHYLKELITLHSQVKKYLSEIHTLLVNKIIDSQFNLLMTIINKLEAPNISILESTEAIKAINEMLDVLIKDNPAHLKALKIREDISRLQELLKKNSIQHQINEELQRFETINFDGFEGFDDFKSKTKSIEDALRMYHLEALGKELKDLIPLITRAIAKIEEAEAHYIKKEVDSGIEKIHQNEWATVNNKKMMHLDLINPINQLLIKRIHLNLSEQDKDRYINQLRVGFELCRSKEFLDLLTTCNTAFYQQNPVMIQQITSYVENSFSTNQDTKSVLKKRIRFSDDPDSTLFSNDKNADEPKNKVQRLSFEDSYSETMRTFINILDPVAPPDFKLSPLFAIAMLKSLAFCISEMNEIRGTNTWMLSNDLYKLALDICPNDYVHLALELKHLISDLTAKNSMAIKDNQRVSSVIVNLSNNKILTSELFKSILSQCIDKLKANIDQKHIDTFIQQLIKTWIATAQKEGKIVPDVLVKITENLQVKANEAIVINSIPPVQQPPVIGRTFTLLGDALFNGSPEEFNDFLKVKSNYLNSNEYFLFLTKKSKNESTIIHTTLSKETISPSLFENIKRFFAELKQITYENPSMFHTFLMHKTASKYTLLHQAAFSGNLPLIIYVTALLNKELGDEGYAKALNVKNVYHHVPSCPVQVKGAKEVNDYLDNERSKFKVRKSLSRSSHARFFDNSTQPIENQDNPTVENIPKEEGYSN